ncbi:MAG: GNAT family N-acetyltransferase [Nitrososphaerales archaeon]
MSEDGGLVALEPRRAFPDEVLAVADLWLLSRQASIPQIPAPVHSDDDVRAWFRDEVFASRDVWVTERSDHLVALMVLDDRWIEQLYVHPAWRSRGIGTQLLEIAKREHTTLDLWTFQSNEGARRFYERHGFVWVALTEGDNEEGAADIRYHWQRR